MEDNKLQSIIWKCACVAVSIIVLTIGSCSVNKQRMVVKLVELGSEPITAHCAIYFGDYSTSASLCTIKAVQKAE